MGVGRTMSMTVKLTIAGAIVPIPLAIMKTSGSNNEPCQADNLAPSTRSKQPLQPRQPSSVPLTNPTKCTSVTASPADRVPAAVPSHPPAVTALRDHETPSLDEIYYRLPEISMPPETQHQLDTVALIPLPPK
jgi:hypothetical protein